MATLSITQTRSTIGRTSDQKRTMKALGLRRLHQTVQHQDSPQIRGMINQVKHLVRISEDA
ncbi:MAG: 50S ribosomal protein L30 [Rhodothermales bacterium]|nr:50S ribosomal protein L30 [Rhodothermales bacterium]